MNKSFYKFLSVVLFFSVIFISCKKSTDNADSGISYGIIGVEPAMASTGDTIKVYGVGFQTGTSANSIKINGVNAKIITASSTELSVVVPAAPRAGKISVQTGSKSFTYNQVFNVATVISGNQTVSTAFTPDKLYLLRGEVHFVKGTALTIQAGTTIMADKLTLASLVIDDGASVAMNGTASQPVVFTSNQPIGLRNPGDWTGITLSASALPGAASDVLNYVRIEYAGYHLPDAPGAALLVNRGTGTGKVQFVQASYSSGDGFRCDAGAGTLEYLKYLVSFGCAGNDFDFAGDSRVIAQFLLGLKDPLYADQFSADGLLVQSSQPVTISNLTLMGPDGLARNTVINPPNYTYFKNFDDILNTHAGRGVHIGGYNYNTDKPINGTLQLFNSVIAAPWLAGISLDGQQVWSKYASGTGSVIKYSSVTYTLATTANTLNHDVPPIRGYVFSGENLSGNTSGFVTSDNTSQSANFNKYNDSLTLQLATPFITATNPNATYDELGLANMASYLRITNPLMTPAAGSALLTGAVFTDSQLNDSYIDKAVIFRGAFGTVDWTKSWSNYVPQQTSYN